MNQWSTTDTVRSSSLLRTKQFDAVREIRTLRPLNSWNPEKFAQAQIRGLVRQVFLSSGGVRQVVLSAVDPDTDVRSVCRRIGEELANEKVGHVAVVEGGQQVLRGTAAGSASLADGNAMRRDAKQVRDNLWLAPGLAGDEHVSREELHSHFLELKHDFEFSIVEASPVGYSDQAIASARAADGIILVLSARHTRRVTARAARNMLDFENVRVLGAVLADRTFPMPQKIYQRL